MFKSLAITCRGTQNKNTNINIFDNNNNKDNNDNTAVYEAQ